MAPPGRVPRQSYIHDMRFIFVGSLIPPDPNVTTALPLYSTCLTQGHIVQIRRFFGFFSIVVSPG